MVENNVLDSTIVKDLSNHIYEKRKATAFQIESLTKSALRRNDSQMIFKIISELTDLTRDGTNSAKMGAITALGSVSVALGSYAIAYFLEQIIKPIFATFRDTDARVRYYACESLYNIAKIARGEILLYFNEVFDVLCILVTDTESSVKNAADILDRLIKDIVSAKSTNYVSILEQQGIQDEVKTHQFDASGYAFQVNNIQDAQKAFSLPKFIPTLLERMYTIDPFAKKFLLSWLELFDDIPSLELITFLPNYLEPLIRFLMNKAPSDVKIETQNILNMFLKEIVSIHKVKSELKRKHFLEEQQKSNQQQSIEDKTEGEPEEMKEDVTQDSDQNSIKSSGTVIEHNVGEQDESVSVTYPDAEDEEFVNGQNIFVDYSKLIDILLSFLRVKRANKDTRVNELDNESHETYLEIQSIVLKWLIEILNIAPTSYLKYLSDCVSVIVQNISTTNANKDFELRNQYFKLSLSLQKFLVDLNEYGGDDKDDTEITDKIINGLNKEVYDDFIEFHLSPTLSKLMQECLNSTNELGQVTALDWLIFLYSKYPEDFFIAKEKNSFDIIDLLATSSDTSNEVILKILQLLSKISEFNQEFFKKFMHRLISFCEASFSEKSIQPSISRGKVELVFRNLCMLLSSEKIYTTLSEVLSARDDLEFLNQMIVTLNNILLTTPELAGFRKKLKNLDVYKIEDWSLFSTLFSSWSHNAASALSLCLLASNYELAYLIIKNLSEQEVTFQLLTQLDVLVQLLESPIFLKLRLQLLEPEKHPYLYKTLYGLLMILPQSSTFTSLKTRLDSVSHVHNLNHPPVVQPLSTPTQTPGAGTTPTTSINNSISIKKKRIYETLDKFTKIQLKHEANGLSRKLKDSFISSAYDTPTAEKALSYHPGTGEKKDYFSIQSDPANDTPSKSSKRTESGRFGLNKF